LLALLRRRPVCVDKRSRIGGLLLLLVLVVTSVADGTDHYQDDNHKDNDEYRLKLRCSTGCGGSWSGCWRSRRSWSRTHGSSVEGVFTDRISYGADLSLSSDVGNLVESHYLSGSVGGGISGVVGFERSKEIREELTSEESLISIASSRHTYKKFTISSGVCDGKWFQRNYEVVWKVFSKSNLETQIFKVLRISCAGGLGGWLTTSGRATESSVGSVEQQGRESCEISCCEAKTRVAGREKWSGDISISQKSFVVPRRVSLVENSKAKTVLWWRWVLRWEHIDKVSALCITCCRWINSNVWLSWISWLVSGTKCYNCTGSCVLVAREWCLVHYDWVLKSVIRANELVHEWRSAWETDDTGSLSVDAVVPSVLQNGCNVVNADQAWVGALNHLFNVNVTTNLVACSPKTSECANRLGLVLELGHRINWGIGARRTVELTLGIPNVQIWRAEVEKIVSRCSLDTNRKSERRWWDNWIRRCGNGRSYWGDDEGTRSICYGCVAKVSSWKNNLVVCVEVHRWELGRAHFSLE